MDSKAITRRDVLKQTSAQVLGTSAASGLLAGMASPALSAPEAAGSSKRKIRIAVVGGGSVPRFTGTSIRTASSPA